MLRSLFVIAIVCVGGAKSLQGPFYALLFYLWIAYFRPETWLWTDFFSQLNLSFIVGVGVLVSTLLAANEKLRFGIGPALMVAFLLQSFLATVSSPFPDYAFIYFRDFLKSTLICLLIVSLVNTEQRLRLTLVIIAASLGFEAVKQGWAQLITNPGGQNTNEIAVLGDNNGVAVGMLMLASLTIALARTAPTRYQRLAARFAAVGIIYRAISTYSRGGFLACGMLGLQYLARSKKKMAGAVGILVTCALIVPALPTEFWDRMNTIDDSREEEAEEIDASIQGRLHFWKIAWDMALDNPFLGVGHNSYNLSYPRYNTDERFLGERSVHNSWLAVTSELGFPGIILFVSVLGYCFFVCARAQRVARSYPELINLAHLANGIEGALLVFCVGGTFVIFQYNELLWHSLALAIAADRIVADRLAAQQPDAVAAAPAAAPAGAPLGGVGMPAPVPVAARRAEPAIGTRPNLPAGSVAGLPASNLARRSLLQLPASLAARQK